MNRFKTLLLGYMAPLSLLSGLPLSVVQAQESVVAVESEQEQVELNQAELDQMLAPIALYPDTLLSHILVASTYPLEVVQAARWRNNNKELDEQQTLDAVESKSWDPSVKALTPFTDLLNKLSDDLSWLQDLGDAFLANEAQVLSTVQNLRHKAYEQGSLTNNQYIEVVEDQDEIVIETVQKEVVYVPYYDTRVVYGNWWWDGYPPLYWHTPVHYVSYAGFYWGPRVIIQPSFYFGGFHWHRRQVVVNYEYRNHPYPVDRHQRVRTKEYQRWQHDKVHRRNARYMNNKVVRSIEQGGSRHKVINRDNRHQLDNRKMVGPQPVRAEHQKPLVRAQSVQQQLKQQRSKPVKVNPTERLNQHNVVKHAQREEHGSPRQQQFKQGDNNDRPIRKVEAVRPELKSYRAQREVSEPVRPRVTHQQKAEPVQSTVNREVSVVRPNKVERYNQPDNVRPTRSEPGVKRHYSRPATKPVRPAVRHKEH
ncbi:DUF3300 domain-containing protein [Neptunicella sp. SCSIO 80796]|uniref:DUF3300 domain-containing protein n=1 Tax=Neptunicella plasticusilytica TaxID=3117012 RepID=UPI003A4E41FC